MVACKHPLIGEAGVDIMKRGGNAVDAAVAAAFVDCVVEPALNGIGGEGVMAIHMEKTGEDIIIDYVGRPSKNCSPDMYELEPSRGRAAAFGWTAVKDDANIFGYKAATVPGEVAGLCTAMEKYGTMSLEEVMQPAIKIANEGFAVGWPIFTCITASMEVLSRFPEWVKIFLKEGRFPYKMGSRAMRTPLQTLIQKDLAESLKKIARGGPDAFYKGEIAEAIARDMRKNGGLITIDDLASYEPIVTKPTPGSYRGYDIIYDPTHAGTTLIEALNILEGFDLNASRFGSLCSVHLVTEALRLAFADRFKYMGDPGFVKVPQRGLTSKEYAEERRKRINLNRATKLKPGEPWKYEGEDTTALAVVDKDRNMVSINQTLVYAFGSGVVIDGTGIVLNDAMAGLNPEPGHANSIQPWKRRIQNVCPTLFLKEGRPYLNIGAPGGRAIPASLVQVIVNVVDHKMGIQEAIEAPRVTTEVEEVYVDDRIPEQTCQALKRMGHNIIPIDRDLYNFAKPVGILVDHKRDLLHGGVDCFFIDLESQTVGY
jgi:gamma-glutamyltranspeptidase/glutathione hydrolase